MHEQKALQENGKMEMFIALVGHQAKLKAHAASSFAVMEIMSSRCQTS